MTGVPGQGRTAYTGNEPAIPQARVQPANDGSFFGVANTQLPPGAVPIYDSESQVMIGYRGPYVGGIARIYDLEGQMVSMEERGLETPLIDPIDFIFIFGGLLKIVSRGVIRATEEIAANAAAKAATRGITAPVVAALRAALRRIMQRELQFTAVTAARMADKGRYVPVAILKLAIRYGKRTPDPQGVPGAFLYTIKMFREPKVLGGQAREYILKVVLRERDWTVLHFHYE